MENRDSGHRWSVVNCRPDSRPCGPVSPVINKRVPCLARDREPFYFRDEFRSASARSVARAEAIRRGRRPADGAYIRVPQRASAAEKWVGFK